ncbi:O-antigen ligase family protein [Arthrobacter sp. NPDC056691]|uniref:O-antigen ligase family protein n=1 Tax=Arthrobacter sp. NPDC056691 TaxID=3345913 RepID=UPI003670A371
MDFAGALVAVTGLVALAMVVWHVRTWPALGWILVGLGAVLNSDAAPKALFAIGGTNIFAEDAVVGVLLLAALSRKIGIRTGFGGKLFLPATTCFLLLFSLVLGYAVYGIPAIVEFRPFLYFVGTLVWATSLDWSSVTTELHVRRFFYVCGWGITVVALINLAKNGIASSSDMYIDSDGTYRTLRPLVASQAALLAVAGVFVLHDWGRQRGGLRLASGAVFIVVAIIAQHRSVWTALAAGVLILAISSDLRVKRRLSIVSVVGAYLVVMLAISGVLDGVFQSLMNSVDAITANKSTLEDRTSGWESLVADSLNSGPAAVLFGQPFGTGYLRIGPTGQVQTYAPHNWFVSIYLRSGLLGLSAILVVLAGAWKRLFGMRSVWAGLILCLVVFAMAYSVQWFLAALIGGAIAMSNTVVRRTESDATSNAVTVASDGERAALL